MTYYKGDKIELPNSKTIIISVDSIEVNSNTIEVVDSETSSTCVPMFVLESN